MSNDRYPDRYTITEALLPAVHELVALVEAGCTELSVDEPSMTCYAHRENPARFVELFNRTVEPIVGRCRLSTHLCFGNFMRRAVGVVDVKSYYIETVDDIANRVQRCHPIGQAYALLRAGERLTRAAADRGSTTL